MKMKDVTPVQKLDSTPTWLKNPSGITVCLPRFLAMKRLQKEINWSLTEPEDVPKTKQYPSGRLLTAEGRERRVSISEYEEVKKEKKKEVEAVKEESEEDKLRQEAKAAGVKSWHVKSLDTLKAELEELSNNK